MLKQSPQGVMVMAMTMILEPTMRIADDDENDDDGGEDDGYHCIMSKDVMTPN